MLPDWSLLIGQKLVENAKIKNFKCDILSYFQTMCKLSFGPSLTLDFFSIQANCELWEFDPYPQVLVLLIWDDLKLILKPLCGY